MPGTLSTHGELILVVDIHSRFFSTRPLSRCPTDQGRRYIVARTNTRKIALRADQVPGYFSCEASCITPAADLLPGLAFIDGIIKREGLLILYCDLNRLLNDDELRTLNRAAAVPHLVCSLLNPVTSRIARVMQGVPNSVILVCRRRLGFGGFDALS